MYHIKGDLLDNDCDMIVQQLNCLCVRPHGLSNSISLKYPYADVYRQRRPEGSKNLAIQAHRPQPGTAVVSRPSLSTTGPLVVGLFGQYDFGKSYYRSYRPQYKIPETKQLREQWFQNGLNLLRDWMVNNKCNNKDFKIGFPYKIGCGLAGGIWNNYIKMIDTFNNQINCQVNIYHLTD